MWGGTEVKASTRAIHACLEQGITSIDTAPIYGFGHSEKVLGEAIKGKRDRYEILTRTFQETFDDPALLEALGLPAERVAMVGDSFLYHLLYTRDEDFKKIFKLRADFDSVMTVNSESLKDYQHFVNRIVGTEELQNFDQKAVARVVEFGVLLPVAVDLRLHAKEQLLAGNPDAIKMFPKDCFIPPFARSYFDSG
mgnify:CR=1 FL=1